MSISKMNLGAIAVAVVSVIVVASVYLSTSGAFRWANLTSVPITLTDPPQVPSGTNSLIITYSSVQVHVVESASNTTSWVSASGSGRLNLMQLLNLSQTIAAASVPKNSTIDMVRFNVTSSKITINGTTYNVTVPSSRITAHIKMKVLANGNSTLLLQLSPTVASVVTANSTVFVLVPSLKAVVVPGSGASTSAKLQVGNRTKLTDQDRAELANGTENITITSARITVSGNNTAISVTVKNNANTNVTLKGLGVFGNESFKLNNTGILQRAQQLSTLLIANISNSSVCRQSNSIGIGANGISGAGIASSGRNGIANLTVHSSVSINESEGKAHNISDQSRISFDGLGFSSQLNSSSITEVNVEDAGTHVEANIRGAEDIQAHLNSSVCTASGQAAFRSQILRQLSNMSMESGDLESHIRMVVFKLNANGTLALPSSGSEFEGTGVVLAPNRSMTFGFNGPMQFARAHVLIVPMHGISYRLTIIGEEDAIASMNVTAS